jgi:hypothetical protein
MVQILNHNNDTLRQSADCGTNGEAYDQYRSEQQTEIRDAQTGENILQTRNRQYWPHGAVLVPTAPKVTSSRKTGLSRKTESAAHIDRSDITCRQGYPINGL